MNKISQSEYICFLKSATKIDHQRVGQAFCNMFDMSKDIVDALYFLEDKEAFHYITTHLIDYDGGRLLKFPYVVHNDGDHTSFGVTVPDLQGCFSAGDTLNDTKEQVKDAILLHIEMMLSEDENAIIKPKKIEDYVDNDEYKDGYWAYVEVDVSSMYS